MWHLQTRQSMSKGYKNATFLPSDHMIKRNIFGGHLLVLNFHFGKMSIEGCIGKILNVSIDSHNSIGMGMSIGAFILASWTMLWKNINNRFWDMVWRSLEKRSEWLFDTMWRLKPSTSSKYMEDWGNQRLRKKLNTIRNHLRWAGNY